MSSKLYLIALLPSVPLRERVRALKEEVRSRFGAGHALKSPAHITLQMPFRLESDKEAALLRLLAGFGKRQQPFSVELQGFGAFPPRVIFLKIVDHQPIAALEGSLRELLAGQDAMKIETSHLPFHPHMTLATRDLTEPAFEQAWQEFKDRPFEAAFEVASVFLLKHNGQSWDVFREFGFGAAS